MKNALPSNLAPAIKGISSKKLPSTIHHGQGEALPSWNSVEALLEIHRLMAAGLTARQIGERWGVTKNAVQKRLARQRKKESLKRFSALLTSEHEKKRRAPVPENLPEWRSDQAEKVIVGLSEGGWSHAAIGGLFGVTRNAVQKRFSRIAARSGNIGVMKDRTVRAEVSERALVDWNSPDVLDEVRRLRESGMSISEIARRFGLPRTTMWDRLVRLKIVFASSASARQKINLRNDDDCVENPDKNIFVRRSREPESRKPGSLVVSSGCRWPMWGNNERPTHVYCGKPVVRAKWPGVYCEECLTKAFSRNTGMAKG
jgi:DNA-directed RNA polymerase specialized sigma24 family protein